VRNTFIQTLYNRALEDSRIILISGDLGFGVLDKFQSDIPDQFINAGIAEQSMLSIAAGLASRGLRPFVYSIANFPTFRALEQIRNDVCYMRFPVTVVSVGAGLAYGNLGYSHHAIEDISVMRSLPNLIIYSPGDLAEVNYSVEKILESNNPAYLRLGKGGELENFSTSVEISGTRKLVDGKDGSIAFTGAIGEQVLKSVEILNLQGIHPSIFSIPEITSQEISKLILNLGKGPLLTVEEHVLPGGFGSYVLEVANDVKFEGRIDRLGLTSKDFSELGKQSYLRTVLGLGTSDIVSKFRTLISA
jgi:transketolase